MGRNSSCIDQVVLLCWALRVGWVLVAGTRMVGEKDLAVYLSKFDQKYWLTYKVLDILQKVMSRPLGSQSLQTPCTGVNALFHQFVKGLCSAWNGMTCMITKKNSWSFPRICCSFQLPLNPDIGLKGRTFTGPRCFTGPTRRARRLWRCARASTSSA